MKVHSKEIQHTSKPFRQKKILTESEKNEICNICGMRFPTKWALKNHSDVHTTLMHFYCQHCSRGFKQGGTTKRHEQMCAKKVLHKNIA